MQQGENEMNKLVEIGGCIEIPFNVSFDDIADMLSDEYGFCVFGFDIEQVEK